MKVNLITTLQKCFKQTCLCGRVSYILPGSLWLLTFRAGCEIRTIVRYSAKTAGSSATEKCKDWVKGVEQITASIPQTSVPVTWRDSKSSFASKSWGCQAFGVSPPDEIVYGANWFPVDFQSSLRTYFPSLFSQVEMATKVCGYKQLTKHKPTRKFSALEYQMLD